MRLLTYRLDVSWPGETFRVRRSESKGALCSSYIAELVNINVEVDSPFTLLAGLLLLSISSKGGYANIYFLQTACQSELLPSAPAAQEASSESCNCLTDAQKELRWSFELEW